MFLKNGVLDKVEVTGYDPQNGICKMARSDIKRILFFDRDKFDRTPITPEAMEKLEQLGPLQQKGEGNCGALCLFAAKFARENGWKLIPIQSGEVS